MDSHLHSRSAVCHSSTASPTSQVSPASRALALVPSRAALAALTLGTVGALVAGCTDAQEVVAERTAAVTDPRGRPVTDEDLARITGQPDFADQKEIFDEQGGAIELSRGLVYTYGDNEITGTETRFPVTTRDGGALPDLVHQDTDAGGAFFYTLAQAEPTENRSSQAPAGGSSGGQTNGLFGCGSWSSWSFNGMSCEPHFWCFGTSQFGTYAKFSRWRQCKKGIQLATRRDFVGCGC
jgi:hypothetical protein